VLEFGNQRFFEGWNGAEDRIVDINNSLENLKEINILIEWPKLIILDISGNPFC